MVAEIPLPILHGPLAFRTERFVKARGLHLYDLLKFLLRCRQLLLGVLRGVVLTGRQSLDDFSFRIAQLEGQIFGQM